MRPDEIGGPSGPFIQAVCAAALTATSIIGIAAWLDSSAPAPPLPLIVLVALIASALVIALAAALIGLPLTRLLARRRREGPWIYPLAGLAAGAAVMIGLERIGLAGRSAPCGRMASDRVARSAPGPRVRNLVVAPVPPALPTGERGMKPEFALSRTRRRIISPANAFHPHVPSNAWSDNG